ncbi:hypothetical protein EZS27_004538 [termite gut metagenome]|uniref:F5/8 type C domain-containing protein n=1 Tax=termite gut metagenome TaxID=433724 RepID=A0A5J4SRF9_9ZZZZ
MKIKLYFIICAVAAVMVQSCNDGIPEKLEFKQFRNVFFSAAGTVRNVTLASQRDTSFVFGNISYGGTTDYEQGKVVAEILADPSLVEAYNVENQTEYELLPANAFAFDNTQLQIENGRNYSKAAKLFVAPQELVAEKPYMLPVTVNLISAPEGMNLNEDRKTAYWIFTYTFSPPQDQDIEKNKWTIDSHHDTWSVGYEPEKAIDGDPNTPWHTGLGGAYPYWFIIDFHKTLKVSGIIFQNRLPANVDVKNFPLRVKWELSEDKVTWQTILEDNALSNTLDEQQLPCTTVLSGQYLKFSVYEGWIGAPYTYVGEMSIY